MAKKDTQEQTATDYETLGLLRIEFSVTGASEGLVVVSWDGARDLPLNGWQIRDNDARNTYAFGDLTLSPGATVKLHSGGEGGQDSASDLYWDGGEVRWNEDDVLHLLDPLGIVHAQCVCATATTRGAIAETKQRTITKKTATQSSQSRPQAKPVAKPAARSKRIVAKNKTTTRATKSVAVKYDTHGALRIGAAAKFNAPRPGIEDEHDVLSIAWDGAEPLSLQDWQVLYQDTGQRYTFGDVTLAPGSVISLHAGGDPADDTTTDFYGGRARPDWNDHRNAVSILDPDGKIQAEYSFTTTSRAAEASIGSDRVTTVSFDGREYDVPPADASERAMRSIWTYTAIGAGIGLVPIPLFDLAALTSLQLLMINGLGEIYNVKFTEGIGRKTIISLIGASLPLSSLRFGAFSLLRIIPLVGPVVAGVTVPILAGATTYAVGKVFNLHFATGGTFLSFDPQRYKQQFQREFALGMKIVQREQQQ